jgi:replicative DNA helicase
MNLPRAIDAERNILSAILYDYEVMSRVSDLLVPADFYDSRHKRIYSAMIDLYAQSKPIDLVNMGEVLRGDAIADFIGLVSSSVGIEHTARVIKEKSILRSFIVSMNNFLQEAQSEPSDLFEFIEKVEREIYGLSHKTITRQFVTLKQAMTEAIEHIEYIRENRTVLGIGSGFPLIDRVTSGFQNTDMITIAGRPGSGKTAIGLNMARNMIHSGKKVGFFSLEMSREQLALRLASMESGRDHTDIRMGRIYREEDWQAFLKSINRLYVPNLVIDDSSAIGLTELRAKARRMISQYGVQIFFIDYLQIMKKPNKSSRDEAISELTGGIKALAKDLKVPIVTFSQLNRRVEERKDAMPVLSDLRESGAIEQDSDIVGFVYRPEIHGIEQVDGKSTEGYAEFIVAKNRHGMTGSVELYFKKENVLFTELSNKEEPSVESDKSLF